MGSIKMLKRDLMPCWYELSWLPTRTNQQIIPTILLRIHQDYLKHMWPVDQDAPIVASYLGSNGLGSFQGSLYCDFGFNKALTFVGEYKEFIEFRATLPRVKNYTEKPCPMCGGSAKERDEDEKCFHCNGTGHEYQCDWEKLYPVSVSLAILFMLLAFPEHETSSPHKQLMEVQLASSFRERGEVVFGIGGTYSIPFVKWLSDMPLYSNIPEMTDAMRTAYYQMMTNDHINFPELEFRASVDSGNGWLNVSCPGNACGLNPHHAGIQTGRGYDFSDHNVDNPAQQLTLLAGLAALHDKARKEIQ